MSIRLSEAERRGFHEAGYCAPLRAMSKAEAQHYRAELERFERRWPNERHMLDQGASLLCPWIDAFTRHPGLLDPMEDLLGPNLLVWGVSLRLKEPDGRTFAGWHQDTAYCDIKPIVVIAALALSRLWRGRRVPARDPRLPSRRAAAAPRAFRHRQPAHPRAADRRPHRRERRGLASDGGGRGGPLQQRDLPLFRPQYRRRPGASSSSSSMCPPTPGSTSRGNRRCWCGASIASAISMSIHARPRR